ncbi:MAG: IS5 family transposase [bacterium]
MKFEKIKDFNESKFRRITGAKRTTFNKMVEIITTADAIKKAKGGRPNSLTIEDRILMTLEYLREYRTYAHIAASYGLSESNTFENIRWIEDTLIKCEEFNLPGKKELSKSDTEYEVILIDATEIPIERPKKKQHLYYSGKKKRHTIKTQVVVDKSSKKIICTDTCNGKKHDFKLFEKSKTKIAEHVNAMTDTGYIGMQKIHLNTSVPRKKSKLKPLTSEDKQYNRELSRKRVLNEHVIGNIKRFKIISDKYRNRRKRFGLRFNLISGIYNYELL